MKEDNYAYNNKTNNSVNLSNHYYQRPISAVNKKIAYKTK